MKKTIIYILIGILGQIFLTNCEKNKEEEEPNTIFIGNYGTLKDVEGNNYAIVKIGSQWWMAENLKVTSYPDNQIIPNATSDTVWTETGRNDACWVYNNNLEGEKSKYGVLYTFDAARKACPAGWHLPSSDDWNTLRLFLDTTNSVGEIFEWSYTDDDYRLKSSYGWDNNRNGSNEVGFSALPAGIRSSFGAGFYGKGSRTLWWTTFNWENSQYDDHHARVIGIGSGLLVIDQYKLNGLSVRCVMNN